MIVAGGPRRCLFAMGEQDGHPERDAGKLQERESKIDRRILGGGKDRPQYNVSPWDQSHLVPYTLCPFQVRETLLFIYFSVSWGSVLYN
jgi:hypothetical protein